MDPELEGEGRDHVTGMQKPDSYQGFVWLHKFNSEFRATGVSNLLENEGSQWWQNSKSKPVEQWRELFYNK